MPAMRRILIGFAFLIAAGHAPAAEITVIGLFPGKAVVVIDGAKPRTLHAGERTSEGVKLVEASSESATFEVGGKRETLGLGHHAAAMTAGPPAGGSVAVTADPRGHFITTGTVNGISVRFMVDTGASTVALSVDDARRAGVNYLVGTPARVQTANGSTIVHMVKLDAVQVGDIVVNNVDAAVIEGDKLPVALLGMSFLNRMEMKRAGDTLTLIRRY